MSDLTLSQLNGRFKLLSRPVAAPGKCAVCGAVNRAVIDFNFDLDYYGAVYFCVECLKAAAEILGLVDGELLTRAELIQRAHVQQLTRAEEITGEYVSRFADLHDEFTGRLHNLSVSTAEDLSKIKSESSTGKSDDSSTAVESTDRPAEQKHDSSRDERSSGVSSSSDNGWGASIFDIA